jgi:hypothetical protein
MMDRVTTTRTRHPPAPTHPESKKRHQETSMILTAKIRENPPKNTASFTSFRDFSG